MYTKEQVVGCLTSVAQGEQDQYGIRDHDSLLLGSKSLYSFIV